MTDHIVAKFGGTSLADADQFRKVIAIVKADPRRRFVVVSAPGKRRSDDFGVTDALLALYKLPPGSEEIAPAIARLNERFEGIRDGLGLNYRPSLRMHAFYREYAKKPTEDALASLGEFLTAHLLAEALGYAFVDSRAIIVVDAKGRVDMAATRLNADVLLKHSVGCVIPGFYGALPNGEVKLLGRGSSNVSGATIAAITDAALFENWTDVSGIMAASPRVVHEPKVIDVLSRSELCELAYWGAKVMHHQTVTPLKGTAIPINVRNTNRPDDPGTLVVPDGKEPQRRHGTIVGVAGKRGFTALTLEKAGLDDRNALLRSVLEVFSRHGVTVEHTPGGIDSLCVVVENSALRGKTDLICSLLKGECGVDSIDIRPNLALVCTVGNAMRHAHGVASKVFTAVDGIGVSISLINQGTNERNIIIGVDDDALDDVIRAIYGAFHP